jgi:hypothetical protein
MKANSNKYLVLNSVFIVCVLTLLVNDHYLKYEFSNWLTGKLSDMAGIIIFPLLLAFIFPKLKQYSTLVSAILFAFWKSPFSQTLIDLYNQISFIQTSRVIDLTDLYVLSLLPIPHFIINRIETLNFIKIQKVNTLLVLLPTFMALMATTLPPNPYYTRTGGNLACYKCSFTVNYNQFEIVEKLKNLNIVFDSIAPIDSLELERNPSLKKENVHIYRLNQLIIDKDTLRYLDFTMRTIKVGKTRIYFNGMQVPDSISTMNLDIKLRKNYKKLLFKYLKPMLQ